MGLQIADIKSLSSRSMLSKTFILSDLEFLALPDKELGGYGSELNQIE